MSRHMGVNYMRNKCHYKGKQVHLKSLDPGFLFIRDKGCNKKHRRYKKKVFKNKMF